MLRRQVELGADVVRPPDRLVRRMLQRAPHVHDVAVNVVHDLKPGNVRAAKEDAQAASKWFHVPSGVVAEVRPDFPRDAAFAAVPGERCAQPCIGRERAHQ
jgi:hypothetical protein